MIKIENKNRRNTIPRRTFRRKRRIKLRRGLLSGLFGIFMVGLVVTTHADTAPLMKLVETNDVISSDMTITINSEQVDLNKEVKLKTNDILAVKFNYKVINGSNGLKDGDVLSMTIPDTFKEIKPEYPSQHFKSCTTTAIPGTHLLKVELVAGGAQISTAVAGYLNMSCKVTDTGEQQASEIKVEFKEVKLEIPVKVGEISNINMTFDKTSQTQKPINILPNTQYNSGIVYPDANGNVVGQKIAYKLNINKNLGRFKEVVVKDIIPDGLNFISTDAKVLEITADGKSSDVTAKYNVKSLVDGTGLNLGDIQNRFEIDYVCEITKDLEKFENKAILCFMQNGTKVTQSSESVTNGTKDEYANGMDLLKTISQDGTNYSKSLQLNPSKEDLSNKVFHQKITVNGNKETKGNTLFEDVLPKELTLLDSLKIYKVNHNVKQDVTAEYKARMTSTNTGFKIDFGDISNIFSIEYDIKLNMVDTTSHDITNLAKLTWGTNKVANESSTLKIIYPVKEIKDFYKKINGNTSVTLAPNSAGTFVGQQVNYSILVNGLLESKFNVKVTDKLPKELALNTSSIKISKDIGYSYMDVTSSYKDKITADATSLIIDLGNTKDKFLIEFNCKITAELTANLVNTAEITYNTNQDVSISCTGELGKTIPGTKNLTKVILDNWNAKYTKVDSTYQGKPITKGTILKYQIYINDKMESIQSGVLVDNIPEGMKMVDNSLYIAEFDYGKEVNVTNKYKDATLLESNKITVNFGATDKKFIVRYDLQIIDMKADYDNTCSFNGQSSSITVIPSTEKPKENYPLVTKYIEENRWITPSHQEMNMNEDLAEGGILGKPVSYIAVVNADKSYRSGLTFEDEIPDSLEYVENSIQVDSSPNTNQYKVGYNKETHKISIDFGDTSSQFIVRYTCIIKSRVAEILNKATATSNGSNNESVARLGINLDEDGNKNIVKYVKSSTDASYGRDCTLKLSKQDTNILNKNLMYKVILNPNGKTLSNVSFKDMFPKGAKLTSNDIHVYHKDLTSGNWIYYYKPIITNANNPNEFNIDFGNINTVYKIEYSLTILDNELNDLRNQAIINYTEGSDESFGECIVDRGEVTLNKEQNGITKETFGDKTMVTATGDILQYKLAVNPECNCLKGVKIKDYIPNGMSFLTTDYKVVRQDSNGAEIDVTNNVAKYGMANGVYSLDLGDISDTYNIYYKCKVESLLNNYTNKAEMSTLIESEHREINCVSSFSAGAGGLNAQKYVDKTFVGESKSDQIVTYSIKLWGNAILPTNCINITDKLDSRLKVIDIAVPEGFTSKYNEDTHEVSVINNEGILDLNTLKDNEAVIRIRTDFTDVSLGAIVENIAKINDYTTSKVKTTKSYTFLGCKKDKDTGIGLKGVVFNLLDKDFKIIKTVTSGDDGKIQGTLDSSGIYYLQELTPLDGYEIFKDKIKIELTEDDITKSITNVDLGTIYNKHIDVTKEVPTTMEPTITSKEIPKETPNTTTKEINSTTPTIDIVNFEGHYTPPQAIEEIKSTMYLLPKTGDRESTSASLSYYRRVYVGRLQMWFNTVLTTIRQNI